jgi:type IV pilus assembly protein PilQ
MKTFLTILGVIFAVVSAQAASKSTLSSATMEEREGRKKVTLKFSSEVPQYTVSQDKKNGTSDIRWKDTGTVAIKKNFVTGGSHGIHRILVNTIPKSQIGFIRLWHGPTASYELANEGSSNLALWFPQRSSSRSLASFREVPEGRERTISINVKNSPVMKVLRSVAAESGRSLVFGDEVKGSISATVRNLSYEDAVDTILKPTGYRAEHSGNATIVRSEKAGRSFRAFRLKFIDVGQVAKTVQDVVSKDGQISVDQNSNSIFVVDRLDNLNNLEQMIAVLDQEPRQVEVEAAIVQLDDKNSLDLAVGMAGDIHHKEVNNDFQTSNLAPSTINPANVDAKGLFFGLSWKSVRGILSALASKSKLSVIARPRVVALSDQEASIIIGSQLGYKTITVTQNGNVQDVKFITVGTQLKIKPHITQSGDIIMYIRPEISDGSVDQNTGVPSTNTASSETRIIAKDGQTIVIGGLLRDRLEKKVDKVPILGDIPIIGILFRGSSESVVKNEIVILLSPKIVNGNTLAAAEENARSITQRAAKEIGLTPVQGRLP